MSRSGPLDIWVKVCLENTNKSKIKNLGKIIDFSPTCCPECDINHTNFHLFSYGANEVIYSSYVYNKILDRIYFDLVNNNLIRELRYKRGDFYRFQRTRQSE